MVHWFCRISVSFCEVSKKRANKSLITVDKSRMFSRLQPEDGTFVCLGYYLSRVSARASPGSIHTAVQGLWFNILQKKEEWFIVSYGGSVGLHNSKCHVCCRLEVVLRAKYILTQWAASLKLRQSISTDDGNNSSGYKQHEIIDFNFSLIELWLSNGRKKWWCSSGSSLVSDVSSCSAVQCSAEQHSLTPSRLVLIMTFWTKPVDELESNVLVRNPTSSLSL